MHFSSTDLPVPEPPMITMTVPEAMRQVHPAQHLVGAESLV